MKKIIIFVILFINIFFYGFEEEGYASWYGPDFHGKKTANGEIFNTHDYTAAHKSLPFNSIVKVISLENNKEVIVRINDRGPFVKNRIIDLSMAAAYTLDLIKKGTMKVKIVLLEKGDNKYHKYTNRKYTIQIASFSKEELAINFKEKLKEKSINVTIKKIKINNNDYFRIIMENLNYSELQIYKRKLYENGIKEFKINQE